MATKRVSASAVDWAKFAQAVPAGEMSSFNALQSKNTGYRGVVNALPAEMPKIDFAHYKKLVPALGKTIDEFAGKYAAVKIDFPAAATELAAIDKQEKEHNATTAAWMDASKQRVADAKTGLQQWDKIPPLNQMTDQEWQLYFPGFQPDQKIHSYFNTRNWMYGANHPSAYYYFGNYRYIKGDHTNLKYASWTDERDDSPK